MTHYKVEVEGGLDVEADSEEEAWEKAVIAIERQGIEDFIRSRGFVWWRKENCDDSDNSSKEG